MVYTISLLVYVRSIWYVLLSVLVLSLRSTNFDITSQYRYCTTRLQMKVLRINLTTSV
jgi:hypothetical protein